MKTTTCSWFTFARKYIQDDAAGARYCRMAAMTNVFRPCLWPNVSVSQWWFILQCDTCCSYSIWDSVHCVPGCGALISLYAAFQKGGSRPFVQKDRAVKSQQYTPDLTFSLILSQALFTSLSLKFKFSHLSCSFHVMLYHSLLPASFCSCSKQGEKCQLVKRWTEQTDEG